MFTKYLNKETYTLTGTAAFDLPNYTPNDTDICIVCKNTNDEYFRITQKIESFAKDHDVGVKWVADYQTPFDWGGRTFARANILQYDIFLVSPKTFETIETVTHLLKNMPLRVKEEMAKDKALRVELFQLIAMKVLNSITL